MTRAFGHSSLPLATRRFPFSDGRKAGHKASSPTRSYLPNCQIASRLICNAPGRRYGSRPPLAITPEGSRSPNTGSRQRSQFTTIPQRNPEPSLLQLGGINRDGDQPGIWFASASQLLRRGCKAWKASARAPLRCDPWEVSDARLELTCPCWSSAGTSLWARSDRTGTLGVSDSGLG